MRRAEVDHTAHRGDAVEGLGEAVVAGRSEAHRGGRAEGDRRGQEEGQESGGRAGEGGAIPSRPAQEALACSAPDEAGGVVSVMLFMLRTGSVD